MAVNLTLSSPCTSLSHLILKAISTSHFWHCPIPICNVIMHCVTVKLHHSSPGFKFHTPNSAHSTLWIWPLQCGFLLPVSPAWLLLSTLVWMYICHLLPVCHRTLTTFCSPSLMRVDVALVLNLYYCNPCVTNWHFSRSFHFNFIRLTLFIFVRATLPTMLPVS